MDIDAFVNKLKSQYQPARHLYIGAFSQADVDKDVTELKEATSLPFRPEATQEEMWQIVKSKISPGTKVAAWADVFGDKKINFMISCRFPEIEKVISLMSYTDGSFEVGQGESTHPYERFHTGSDEKEAMEVFEEKLFEAL